MRRLAYSRHENETMSVEMTGIRFKSRFSGKVERHRPSELNVTDFSTVGILTVPESTTMVGSEPASGV